MASTNYSDYNILMAGDFRDASGNEDLKSCLDEAVAAGGNTLVILSPGTTYAGITAEKTITSIDNVIVEGNGATITAPDLEESIFLMQTCDNWVWRDINFVAADDADACLRAFIFELGCGTITFENCEFSGFGASIIRGRGGGGAGDADSGHLIVTRCRWHDLGNERYGGANSSGGVDCSRFSRATITDCEAWDIGSTDLSHAVYPSRGTEDVGADGAMFLVANSKFRNISGFAIKFSTQSGGTIANASANNNQYYDCRGVVFTDVQNAVAVGNVSFADNSIIRVDGGGADNVNFTANTIYNSGTISGSSTILVSGNIGSGVIANNYSFGLGAFIQNNNEILKVVIANNNAPYCGQFLISLATKNIEDVLIANNQFGNVTSTGGVYGILIQAGNNITIVDNRQITPASGTLQAMMEFDSIDRLFVEGNIGDNGTVYRNTTNLTNSLLGTAWYWNQSGAPRRWWDQFTGGDTTPSVIKGDYFKTSNGTSTTITGFDDAIEGKEFWVLINDANTTLDFTASNLSGNAGVDYTCSNGDMLHCFKGASKTHVWISSA